MFSLCIKFMACIIMMMLMYVIFGELGLIIGGAVSVMLLAFSLPRMD